MLLGQSVRWRWWCYVIKPRWHWKASNMSKWKRSWNLCTCKKKHNKHNKATRTNQKKKGEGGGVFRVTLFRVIVSGLWVRSSPGLQACGEIVLTLGLHKIPSANLWAHISPNWPHLIYLRLVLKFNSYIFEW